MNKIKTVLITGASRGIGLALANEYLKNKTKVISLSRTPPPQETLLDKNHSFFQVNLSQLDTLQTTIKDIFSKSESISLAILNAGVLSPLNDLKNTPLSTIKETMDINVWSNKLIIDELINHYEPPSQIIAISSGAAVSGNRGWNAYSLSKATLNMLTKLYASECKQTHFCALAPGLVDTAMQDYLCSLNLDKKYSTLTKLKNARGTDVMPTPEKLAPILLKLFPKLTSISSGSFVDIRKLENTGIQI